MFYTMLLYVGFKKYCDRSDIYSTAFKILICEVTCGTLKIKLNLVYLFVNHINKIKINIKIIVVEIDKNDGNVYNVYI